MSLGGDGGGAEGEEEKERTQMLTSGLNQDHIGEVLRPRLRMFERLLLGENPPWGFLEICWEVDNRRRWLCDLFYQTSHVNSSLPS